MTSTPYDDTALEGGVSHNLKLEEPQKSDEQIVQNLELWILSLLLALHSSLISNQLQFVTDFFEFQHRDSSSGRLLFAFVKRTLRQFQLEDSYPEAYVLNESFIRGIQRIREGEIIRNSAPWLRKTSYNVIRELKRDQQKTVSFEDYMLEDQTPAVPSEDLEDDLITVRLAFQMLDVEDQNILNLRIVKGLSWSEIQAIFKRDKGEDHPESRLRKRKERALIRLRKKFHALKPPVFGQENNLF